MTTAPTLLSKQDDRFSVLMRRVGYSIAIGINLVLLWVINNLVAWGWPPFLTRGFETLVPSPTVLGRSMCGNRPRISPERRKAWEI